MGVPKFFRFVSERYPLISQLVQENRIPEFDNLYLDMNGVIHNCSHPNDNDAHFRITEEQIFLAIFAYIEHLFGKIKPKKLFFMAIDGVAPRAKMNQQRSRRFRTAKEALEGRERALAKGEELPETAAFDSNCITPGTPFMARLSEQLKYFVNKKVSEDANWRGVEIVLSGHDVPGEGEHKIMEYIRLAKAQPGYNPNVRHCLYGLDADLIMLGLLSHDPHFCLLREEVTFGPAKKKAKAGLEQQNFYLMHLSLLREYLDLEFSSLALKDVLPFSYDLERVIDDFILLAIFVGNDFMPHLPGLHINGGAINLLFDIYKKVLPKAGGYLNEHGNLNTKRLAMVINELVSFEKDQFEHEYADSNWFKGKQTKYIEAMEQARARSKLVLTKTQRELFDQVKAFLLENLANPRAARIVFPARYPARDRRFLQDLADELRMSISFDEFDENDENIIVLSFDPESVGLMQADNEAGSDDDGEWEDDEEDDREWKEAIGRVLKKYEKAPVKEDVTEEDFEDQYAKTLNEKMDNWKREYYKEKLELNYDEPEDINKLIYSYVEGLQWVLHYYYDGVASWGWFYPYHYAPKISDLKHVESMSFNFDIGKPFYPFEQLMGVMPALSSDLLPEPYRDLMSDSMSPIIDFYPKDFEADLNGKKQEWEAIVKIPFIDEKRLLAAMKTREHKLTADERQRNSFGPSWRFIYDGNVNATYPSSLPGFFPDLHNAHCKMEEYHLPTMDGLRLVKGLCEGVLIGKDAIAGFPSLHTLPHSGSLGFHHVNVFQSESRSETMVINIDNTFEGLKVEDLARAMIGKTTFAGWPFLQEAQVVAVSDDLFRYELEAFGQQQRVRPIPHRPEVIHAWRRTADRLEHVYSKRFGTLIGGVDVILHVKLLKGLKLLDDGALVKEFDEREIEQAVQATVQHVSAEDTRYTERAAIPVNEDFPEGSKVFFLGSLAYGCPAQVIGHEGDTLATRIAYHPSDKKDNLLFKSIVSARAQTLYFPSHIVTRRVKMAALTLSKITSSVLIEHGGPRINIGLNLKFEAKGQKVIGYTRKGDGGWEYSEKAIELIQEYKNKFPEVIASLDNKRGMDLTMAADFFPAENLDTRVHEIKAWIQEKGVRDFEQVSLFSDQLDKAGVMEIEALANKLSEERGPVQLKQAVVRRIPRKALLKPSQGGARLLDQRFELGDRVIMVQDSGNVPLAAKGVVVGIQGSTIDVVFDIPFIGGTSLSDRCSAYRGMSVSPSSVLNLTAPQFLAMTQARQEHGGFSPQPHRGNGHTRGRGNPNLANHPSVASQYYSPGPQRGRGGSGEPVQILAHPGRGRGTSNDFSGNYGGAARGEPTLPPAGPRSQQDILQSTINGPQNRGRAPRAAYHNVAPPAALENGSPRARGGGFRGRGARGNHASHATQDGMAAFVPTPQPPPPPPPSFVRGAPNGPSRGRGRGSSSDGQGSRGRGSGRGRRGRGQVAEGLNGQAIAS